MDLKRWARSQYFRRLIPGLGLLLALVFSVKHLPINEGALSEQIRKEVLKSAELEFFQIKGSRFRWSTLSWEFEMRAQVKKVFGLDIELKNLSLRGSKKIWGGSRLEQASLRFAENDPNFSGGIEIIAHPDKAGLRWDLSNLEISLGLFQKKMGDPAWLDVALAKDDLAEGVFDFDGLQIPLQVQRNSQSLVVQIPKTQVETKKQRLPFQTVGDFPTSGLWTLALRAEYRGREVSEAATLKVSEARVALNQVPPSLGLRNARGVGLLKLDMSSAERLVNGNFSLDLKDATFELNRGHYFKAEKVPFNLSGTFSQSLGRMNIVSQEMRAEINLDRNSRFQAEIENLPLALLPAPKNLLGNPVGGILSGRVEGFLSRDLLNNKTIEVNVLKAKKAELRFEDFALPGLSSRGETIFTGTFSLDQHPGRSEFSGKLDFTMSALTLGNLYEKEADLPLVLGIKGERLGAYWRHFDAHSDVQGQRVAVKFKNSELLIDLGSRHRSREGGLLSGWMKYNLCGGQLCDDQMPKAFDLKFADFENAHHPLLQGFKISGSAKKSSDEYRFDRLSLGWPSGDRAVLSGTAEVYKRAKLRVTASFQMDEQATANPFYFFKHFAPAEGDFEFDVTLRHDSKLWTIESKADYRSKKLTLRDLQLKKEKLWEASGSAQIDLEPFLLRNEAALLTGTLSSEGRAQNFDGLLMKGRYDATLVMASKGANAREMLGNLKMRVSGSAELDQMPLSLLLSQGLDTYAKERQRNSSRSLARCFPRKLRGKFDLDYQSGYWQLQPSTFQGTGRDSMIKLQGVLGDLTSINVVANYLPGPRCEADLAECLGDAFPKGGLLFEITGPFKNPETNFDFAFLDKSLERCREQNSERSYAAAEIPSAKDSSEQKRRIEELKNFYNARRFDP